MIAKPLDLKKLVKNFPDFPKQGVLFRDINPLISDGVALNYISEEFHRRFSAERPTVIAGIESRGFIIATCIAIRFGLGVIMIRKAGKLPGKTSRQSYQIEYGTAEMEIQQGILLPGQNVIVADDLIATGGTALAASRLLREEGANIIGFAILIELDDLGGGASLRELGYNVQSLVVY
ncbi:MAG: adenine phosphoribosyltransferase [Nitrososphaeraceae archaeon]